MALGSRAARTAFDLEIQLIGSIDFSRGIGNNYEAPKKVYMGVLNDDRSNNNSTTVRIYSRSTQAIFLRQLYLVEKDSHCQPSPCGVI
jgi:hypothetical protein